MSVSVVEGVGESVWREASGPCGFGSETLFAMLLHWAPSRLLDMDSKPSAQVGHRFEEKTEWATLYPLSQRVVRSSQYPCQDGYGRFEFVELCVSRYPGARRTAL